MREVLLSRLGAKTSSVGANGKMVVHDGHWMHECIRNHRWRELERFAGTTIQGEGGFKPFLQALLRRMYREKERETYDI